MIKNIFIPDIYLKNYYDLEIDKLKNIKLILLDADNTLVGTYENNLDNKSFEFIQNIKKNNIIPIIFSNNTKKRIHNISKKLNCDYSSFSLKPFPFSYIKILKKYNIKNNEVLVIGDQLLTDILGGKFMNMYTMLIEPSNKKYNIIGKVSKFIEKIIISYMYKKKYIEKGKYYDNM